VTPPTKIYNCLVEVTAVYETEVSYTSTTISLNNV